MKVLVLNCGSSSLKYQVLDMTNETLLCKGLIERIGMEGSNLAHQKILAGGKKEKVKVEEPMKDHKEALKYVIDAILNPKTGVLKDIKEIEAVGHRAVHGGEKFASSVLVTDEVIKMMEDCIELAPLHNPANITGIKACQELMPEVPEVVVFDTAFHQTMPPESYIYPVPYEYYEKYGVRRYGFHGTSHRYVAQECAKMMGKPIEELNIITCHLGNGGSLCAVKGGKSFDTSMGFTPLAGLAMGTRSGNLDPAIVEFIGKKEGKTEAEVNEILNKKSGILGMSGISSDMRDIKKAAFFDGDPRAEMTIEVFNHRIKSYIGAYMAEMNGADAIVFTAGVGENDPITRARTCKDMDRLGIKLDLQKNIDGKDGLISTDDSKVKVYLIPTNEELMIARDTKEIVEKLK